MPTPYRLKRSLLVYATSVASMGSTADDDNGRKASVIAGQWVAVFLQYAYGLRDRTIDHIQRVLLGVLRAGPIPRHVAFVMDGNRRYARTKGMKVIQGHVDGSVALLRVRPTPPSLINAKRPRTRTLCQLQTVRDRLWKYAQLSTSRPSLYTPSPSTTSSGPKRRWMAL